MYPIGQEAAKAAAESTTKAAFGSPEWFMMMVDDYVVPFAIKLVLAIVVYIIGKWVARAVSRLVGKVLRKGGMDETLAKFLQTIVYSLLLMVVIIAALERLGVKTTAAVAVLGAAGLAVGLALQGSLSNFASGVMIVFFKPYKVGDVITAAGQTGGVQEVGIFNTTLKTPDNRVIIVPNGAITAGPIENITGEDTRRVDLVIGVGYDDDLKKAREVIEGVLASNDKVLKDPAPQVAVSELGDSSVNFVVRPWCKTADYWDAMFSTTEEIKIALDEAGISIPYPQRDIHMIQAS